MNAKISVIVPVKTAGAEFDRHIRSLLKIDYTDFDIIIVDDGMKTPLPIIQEHREKIKVITSSGRGPSFARNLGVAETNADYIAFTDSDCLVAPDWLSELLKGFNEFSQAVACGGAQSIPTDASFFERKVFTFLKKAGLIAEYVKKDTAAITEVGHNASCNVMYKREIFLEHGGFLEGLWPGEDVELDYRLRKAGRCLVYNPRAVVYHYRPKNIRYFCSMMYRYGAVQAWLARRYGIFRKIQIIPLIAAISILTVTMLLAYSASLGTIFLLLLATASLIFFNFDPAVIFLAAATAVSWNAGFVSGLFKKV